MVIRAPIIIDLLGLIIFHKEDNPLQRFFLAAGHPSQSNF